MPRSFLFFHSSPSPPQKKNGTGKRPTIALGTETHSLLTHLGARSAPEGASRAGDEFFPRRMSFFLLFLS